MKGTKRANDHETCRGIRKPGVARFVKICLALIATWALVPVVIFAFPRDLPDVTGLTILVSPLIGLGLLIIWLVTFIVGVVKRSSRLLSGLAILLVLLIGGVSRARGLKWGSQLHLLVNQSRYEATVAKLKTANSPEEREAICGEDCMILSDEPLRVTFHTCDSFLYWPDIVYDPTGAVSETDVSRLKQLNVYLFGAERLNGDWYLANFGD
jgi:hypothetical protein